MHLIKQLVNIKKLKKRCKENIFFDKNYLNLVLNKNLTNNKVKKKLDWLPKIKLNQGLILTIKDLKI